MPLEAATLHILANILLRMAAYYHKSVYRVYDLQLVGIERSWPCLWWVFRPPCALEYGHVKSHVQFLVKFGVH